MKSTETESTDNQPTIFANRPIPLDQAAESSGLRQSQQTEIGEYPSDWIVNRIDSAFEIQQGKQVSKKNCDGENQRLFLRTKNVFWNRLDLSDLDQMHFSEAEQSRLELKANDLLVCEGGSIGRAALWNNEVEECLYQNHLHRLRAKANKVHSQFGVYWLWYAFDVAKLYFGRGNVTTIPNLSRSKLAELPMPLPPLPEQKKISHILSTVQRAIKAQERIIQTTTELKKALMHKLFTEGLRNEPQKQTEIGLVPESWEVVRVDSAFEIQQGKQVSKKNREGTNQRPFLRTKNVFWNRLQLADLDKMNFSEAEETRLELLPGDLLTCEGGDIGRTALWNGDVQSCYFQNHLHRLRSKNGKVDPQFAVYWFWYAFNEANIYFGRGNITTIPNLSRSKLAELPIALPSRAEQIEIVTFLDAVSDRPQAAEHKKTKIEDLFRTLLHVLMAAKIRVDEFNLPSGGQSR